MLCSVLDAVIITQLMCRVSPADADTLRERLAAKVQALREQRKADERKQSAEKAKAWKKEQHIAAMQPAKAKQRCGSFPWKQSVT